MKAAGQLVVSYEVRAEGSENQEEKDELTAKALALRSEFKIETVEGFCSDEKKALRSC